MRYLFIYLLFSLFSYKQGRTTLGVENAKNELKRALSEKMSTNLFVNGAIRDKQSVIKEAEPILFKAYGKQQIINEKPYEVYLINDYWVLSGTLPREKLGGTFLLIINAKDRHIIKLTHYK